MARTITEPPVVKLPAIGHSEYILPAKGKKKLKIKPPRTVELAKYDEKIRAKLSELLDMAIEVERMTSSKFGLATAVLLDGGTTRMSPLPAEVVNPDRKGWYHADWEGVLPRMAVMIADWMPTRGNVCDSCFRRADYCLVWPEQGEAGMRWRGCIVKHANNTGLISATWWVSSIEAMNAKQSASFLPSIVFDLASKYVADKFRTYQPYYSNAIQDRAAWERYEKKFGPV